MVRNFEAITSWLERRPRPEFHQELFGATSAVEIAASISGFCAHWLGLPATDVSFYVVSRGAVAGVELDDGTQVACKFLPLNHDRLEVLEAARRVQASVARSNPAVAEPVLGPVVWWAAACFVDEWRPSCPARDGALPEVRRAMAQGLREVISTLRDVDEPILRHTRYELPTSAPVCGEQDIDEALAYAHAVLARNYDRPLVVGHFDWRTPNAVVGPENEMQAIYDWDSVVVDLEERLVGAAAGFFSVSYTAEFSSVPTPDETADFVATYEAARGEGFGAAARRVVAAAAIYKLAWQAAEEHRLDPTGARNHERSIRRAFRSQPWLDYQEAILS